MHYICADIHGENDKYEAMLKGINFTDQDTLYILGDVIDRKPMGVTILQDIMQRENVKMLLGNHEQMCLATLGPYSQFGARDLWRANGGSSTYREMVYHLSSAERIRILKFLAALPDHLDIEVAGQKYHLVHGFPGGNTEDRIWTRPEPDAPSPIPDKTTIIGHTPVCFLDPENKNREHFQIFYGDGFLDLDCGCGNETPKRRLACLCLETMQEFYF